ncbi:MAG TPA: adenylate/guanylate cyclase domain-containing protein [Acidimicrobiales bacterium]|nr:adenylate/guanylate cyclase domain-containing protein [Acidimicrobiales bacterium]
MATGGLPTGTVTFLFSDIEGSTRLADERRDEWPGLLEEHRRILRTAFGAHGGHEVKTEGDGFFVAFGDAGDAIRAAVDAQLGIQAHPWPGDPIRIRIGMHTGPVEVVDDDYVGLSVHHAARVSGVGYGGQIIVSDAARQLAASARLGDIGLADLGLHRLKDLDAPMRLHQATHPDLPSSFPPLKSCVETPHNLPPSLTSFVGREQDALMVQKLIGEHRLVTLMGAGGAGKTRLATEVARTLLDNRPGGVWFVELAPIADGSLLPNALAEALGLRPAEASTPILDLIVRALGDQPSLIVLDNCEHVVAGAAELAGALLQRTDECRIVATSREALGCAGEHAWKVPSLAVDLGRSGPVDLMESPAVRLFLDRAESAGASFEETPEALEAVAQICERLDGIPLAIELAAARARAMSPAQIFQRLDDRFRLLTGGSRGALPRQQTLQALVDWSHNLLDERERVLLRRLSVFAGGFTLEAAEAVTADDVLDTLDVLDALDGLVSKSLVQQVVGEEGRYRLLETIRHYARQKLVDADEVGPTRDAHLRYFGELAGRVGPELRRREAARWLDLLGAEHDNLRQALAWATGNPGDPDTGAAIVVAARQFWQAGGHLRELGEVAEGLLAAAGELSPYHEGRLRLIAALVQSELTYIPDTEGMRSACAVHEGADDVVGLAQALLSLAFFERDFGEQLALFQRVAGLAREADDPETLARALRAIANSQLTPRAECRLLRSEALDIATREGDLVMIARIQSDMAAYACVEADFEQARRLITEAIEACRLVRDLATLTMCLKTAQFVAMSLGRLDEAAVLLAEQRDVVVRIGGKMPDVLAEVAVLAVARDDDDAWDRVEAMLVEARATTEDGLRWWLNFLLWYTARARVADARMLGLATELERLARASTDSGRHNALHTVAEVLRAQGDARATGVFEEIVADAGASAIAVSEACLGLAWQKLAQGDEHAAAASLEQALATERISEMTASKVIAAAELLFRRGRLEEAARLLGAGRPRLSAMDAMPDVEVATSLEARLRAGLGDDRYEASAPELVGAPFEDLIAETLRLIRET